MITREEVIKKGNVRVPRDLYQLRCIDAKFGISKSSENPMITLTWEIVGPDSITVDGMKADVRGKQLTQYLVLTAKNAGNVFELHEKLGLPAETLDDQNPDTEVYKNLVVDAILSSEDVISRKEPTPEQRASRQQGDPILDGEGKQIVSYRPKLENVLGLSKKEVAAF